MSSRTGRAPVSSWHGDSPEPCLLSCRQSQQMERERERVERQQLQSQPGRPGGAGHELQASGMDVENALDRVPRRSDVMTCGVTRRWAPPPPPCWETLNGQLSEKPDL